VVRLNLKQKSARPPERDYSHRALLDKLGVKPEQRVGVVGIGDEGFLRDLASRVPSYSREEGIESADMIFLAAESLGDLKRIRSFVRAMHKNGAIWVVYPKGRKDIREVDVIAKGKSAGLVDNKVCRFSDTHTALRFVIPLAKR
jgi:hypothetical protein